NRSGARPPDFRAGRLWPLVAPALRRGAAGQASPPSQPDGMSVRILMAEVQMRTVWRTVLVLLVVAGVIAYLGLDRFLKRTIETQSTDSLRLSTTLSRAHLSVLGGKLELNRLQIASPQGFSAPHMLELGDVDLAVRYRQLRNDPIHVQSLRIDKPRLIIEQSKGALNFKKAADGMPAHDSSSEKPVRLVI